MLQDSVMMLLFDLFLCLRMRQFFKSSNLPGFVLKIHEEDSTSFLSGLTF